MEHRKIRVAITHGDTNGIGYELIFKTFAELEMLELCTPIVYGDPKVAAYHRNALEIQANFSIINNAEDAQEGRVNLLACFDKEIKVELGVSTAESNEAAIVALDKAIEDYRKGLYDVLVTAPMDETKIAHSGVKFDSQQAYIESCLGDGQKALPMLVNERLFVATATDNIPLRKVPESITKDLIKNKIQSLCQTLKRDLRLFNPRMAVLALNPYVSDTKEFGQEEKEILMPVIHEMAGEGYNVFGPYPAGEMFGDYAFDTFDGILAMYYDQATGPFVALEPEKGVIYLGGLAAVCTSPREKSVFTQAGKGVADESSFRNAVYWAIDIYRNRVQYDEASENPLKKLYHERREEGERGRNSFTRRSDEQHARAEKDTSDDNQLKEAAEEDKQ